MFNYRKERRKSSDILLEQHTHKFSTQNTFRPSSYPENGQFISSLRAPKKKRSSKFTERSSSKHSTPKLSRFNSVRSRRSNSMHIPHKYETMKMDEDYFLSKNSGLSTPNIRSLKPIKDETKDNYTNDNYEYMPKEKYDKIREWLANTVLDEKSPNPIIPLGKLRSPTSLRNKNEPRVTTPQLKLLNSETRPLSYMPSYKVELTNQNSLSSLNYNGLTFLRYDKFS